MKIKKLYDGCEQEILDSFRVGLKQGRASTLADVDKILDKLDCYCDVCYGGKESQDCEGLISRKEALKLLQEKK